MTRAVLRRLESEVGELVERRVTTKRDFTRYEHDPIGFIREVLGETDPGPWQAQVQIAQAVRDHPFVVVRGCNSSGKDWLAARLTLWWVFAHKGFCIVTGPTRRQVAHIVMGEVARAFRGAKELYGELFQMALRIDGEEQRGILALTSTEASKLTGFHAPRLLTILTEAQAVHDFAFEGLLACRTGEHDRTLAVGNPLEPGTRFHQVSEWAHWHSIKVPATDHPNVQRDEAVIPGGPTRAWIRSIELEYGKDSPQYVARVQAEFPAEATDALIARKYVDEATDRFHAGDLEEDQGSLPYTLGLDPAGPGKDASVLCLRQGGIVRSFKSWRRLEAPELAEMVEAIVLDLLGERVDGAHLGGPGVAGVFIDEIGIGHGVTGILKRKLRTLEWYEMSVDDERRTGRMNRRSIRVEGVNIATSPAEPDRFVRRKDELLWHLRTELVEGRIALPPAEELIEELLDTRMSQTADGRLTTESKEHQKARLGRSPDSLDALMLSLHPQVRTKKRRLAFR